MIPIHPLFQYRKAKRYLSTRTALYTIRLNGAVASALAEQGYEYAQYRLGKLSLGDEIEQDFLSGKG